MNCFLCVNFHAVYNTQGYHFSGISGNLTMPGKRPKVSERSGNLCSRGNLIVAAQQNNLPVLYLYCNSFLYVMFMENLD